jgi:hypothetical protein
VNAQDVIALAPNEIVDEQMQMGEDVGETSMADANRIVVNLDKTILMIKEQENVVPTPILEQENANEIVEPHEHSELQLL